MNNNNNSIEHARSPTCRWLSCRTRRPGATLVAGSARAVRERLAWLDDAEQAREEPSVYALYGGRTHHQRIYRSLGVGVDVHMMRLLLQWCERHGARLHPALAPRRVTGEAAVFRDFQWVVTADVPALTPLLAVPERLAIGFKDTESQEDLDALKKGTTEAAKGSIEETTKAAADTAAAAGTSGGDESDGDVCAFFFTALGLLVNDVLVALNNDITDPRYLMARALQRTRTCHNAPYLEATAFSSGPGGGGDPSLAEVFLQMVHNYIQAGPLTGKVERDMLNWAVSVSLSHSTPLTIAGRRSIGVVPLLHLFSHGRDDVNAVPVTRKAAGSGPMLAKFFASHSPAMALDAKEEYIYAVTSRPLKAGTVVALQAMAPVCNRTEEADDMWRLTCGGPPPEDSVPSSDYQEVVRAVNNEVHRVAAALVSAA